MGAGVERETWAAAGVRIGRGSMRDYGALARHHYRAGPPATVARGADGPAVWAARDEAGNLAGVLVVSMPTLNGAWRTLAWPGRFAGGDRRGDAARINRELRCISRVVVDPRFRAMGVGVGLVRAYLARPLTSCTEAVAAMGGACPLFERAGMTAYRMPPRARDARLIDALAAVGLEPWEVLREGAAGRALDAHPWLGREVRLWASAFGTTRRLADAPAPDLLTFACTRVACPPMYYAYGA